MAWRVVVLLALALVGAAGVLPARAAHAAADGARTVRLVALPDGRLEVRRGDASGPAFAAVGDVVLEEQDVPMSLAALDLESLLDPSSGLVTDERRAEQWHLDRLAVEAVWAGTAGEDQVIAVVDSGVDGTHPDLRDRLVTGWSGVGGDPEEDPNGHGTHVAGIAAAAVGDRVGVVGVAPEARIMPVQVVAADGSAWASDVAEGVLWATDHGADVINLSLAGTQRSQVLEAAITHAVDAGVVVVAAAGNAHRDGNPRIHPASHPDVIGVGAVTDRDERSRFSSAGDWVDLAAPGSAILSTTTGGGAGYLSGTSMAAPQVAAAAALLRAAAGAAGDELAPADVAAALTGSALDLGVRGRDDEFGHGRVDVLAALDALDLAPPAAQEEPEAEEPASDSDGELQQAGPDPAPPTTHYGRG